MKPLKDITLCDYNAEWPRQFHEVATFLKAKLAEHCLEVHHIGSTAVPGLAAKKDIDVLCVVDDLSASRVLEKHGFTFKNEINIPLRYYFSKITPEKINLHVVESEHGFIALNLCFRDYLRDHKDVCKAYSDLKKTILEKRSSRIREASGFPRYTHQKDCFIKETLEKAGYNGFIVNFCMHENEWSAYHRIRKEQIFDHTPVSYDPNHPTMRDPQHYHMVLYKGVKIVSVAHVELLNEGGSQAALRSIATDESEKRKGYGIYLMSFIEKWLKIKAVKCLKMHSNLRAESFYRKCGYTNILFIDTSISEDVIDLGKVFSD